MLKVESPLARLPVGIPPTDKPGDDIEGAVKPLVDKPLAEKGLADKPVLVKPPADKLVKPVKPPTDNPGLVKPLADKLVKPPADKSLVDKPLINPCPQIDELKLAGWLRIGGVAADTDGVLEGLAEDEPEELAGRAIGELTRGAVMGDPGGSMAVLSPRPGGGFDVGIPDLRSASVSGLFDATHRPTASKMGRRACMGIKNIFSLNNWMVS